MSADFTLKSVRIRGMGGLVKERVKSHRLGTELVEVMLILTE